MKKYLKLILSFVVVLLIGVVIYQQLFAPAQPPVTPVDPNNNQQQNVDPTPVDPAPVDPTPAVDPIEELKKKVPEDGMYSTKDEVALYIHLYEHLPSNFMTKKEAKKKGWKSGALDRVVKGYSIGGDVFGNNEGLLPKKSGRTYYECDIDTVGQKKRGTKRIVFSSDGLVYYTEDHYEHFELLYGEP